MQEISGDISSTYRPPLLTKLWYLVFNLIRGLFGFLSIVRASHLQPKNAKTQNDRSPMRVIIDHVFAEIISTHLKEKKVSVLDIGAGTAYFREKLASMGYSGTYTGVDVFQETAYSNEAVPQFTSELVLAPIEEFEPPQKYNLVMSVTTLEHVPDDFRAVEVARRAQSDTGMQIHIVPGFWSLFLYLLHGYRQYNYRRLGKLFVGQPYTVYRLGGLPSFLVHFFCVTLQDRFLRIPVRKFSWYPRLVTVAIKLDRWLPICGYAFVVLIKEKNEKQYHYCNL